MRAKAKAKAKATLKRAQPALARPVVCEVCEEVLFRGTPVVWRGRLKLFGAEDAVVRADWDSMNRLVFRHVELDRCVRAEPVGQHGAG